MVYRRALVTGATSGIGAAFARELPLRTALLLTGRNGDRLKEMQALLRQPGREVDHVQADLARVEDREALIAHATELGIDLLINNAGLGPYGPVLENDADVGSYPAAAAQAAPAAHAITPHKLFGLLSVVSTKSATSCHQKRAGEPI